MIVDIHLHTSEFSPCSRMTLPTVIRSAAALPLDGICITDHETLGHQLPSISQSSVLELSCHGNLMRSQPGSSRSDLVILSGIEILTKEGDVLCFGLHEIPTMPIHAAELIDFVHQSGGITIAAHPYRENGRGLGDNLFNLPDLDGIEAFNGNTPLQFNLKAVEAAIRMGIPVLGGSDAHEPGQIGIYATKFVAPIHSLGDIMDAIRAGRCEPVELVKNNMEYRAASQEY